MSACPRSIFGHSWKRHYWLNGGLYHHGAIQRDGVMCRHCAKVIFDDTDQQHFDSLPEWLKKEIANQNPALRKPAHDLARRHAEGVES